MNIDNLYLFLKEFKIIPHFSYIYIQEDIKKMLLEPECIGCLVDQIYKGLNLLNPSISKEKIIETQKRFMEYLTEIDLLNKYTCLSLDPETT